MIGFDYDQYISDFNTGEDATLVEKWFDPDVVFIEAAQALGKTLAGQSGSIEERISLLFRRVLTRPPTADETAHLAKFFAVQKERFISNEIDAKAIAGDARAVGPFVVRMAHCGPGRTVSLATRLVTAFCGPQSSVTMTS